MGNKEFLARMSDQSLTTAVLRAFSPLDGLKRANLLALAKKTEVHSLKSGQTLFRLGDTTKKTFYLMEGQLQLTNSEGATLTLDAGSEQARNPVAPILPRRYDVKALEDVRFISIDTDLLDVMLTWDQTGHYEVSELEDESEGDSGDWMTQLLQTKVFHKIPPGNIQAIFMRMQQVNYREGDIVVKQGDSGDFFYAISKGNCHVMRETPLNQDGIKLAELSYGDTFGEESLISGGPRNATVIMASDGVLMRLGKDDFNTLLNEPMLDWVDYKQAGELVEKGARWLDVRLPSEYEVRHEVDALNIPLYFIRLKLNMLDANVPYILCCDTGRRSSAAAFILNERGFETRVLKGGFNTNELELA